MRVSVPRPLACALCRRSPNNIRCPRSVVSCFPCIPNILRPSVLHSHFTDPRLNHSFADRFGIVRISCVWIVCAGWIHGVLNSEVWAIFCLQRTALVMHSWLEIIVSLSFCLSPNCPFVYILEQYQAVCPKLSACLSFFLSPVWTYVKPFFTFFPTPNYVFPTVCPSPCLPMSSVWNLICPAVCDSVCEYVYHITVTYLPIYLSTCSSLSICLSICLLLARCVSVSCRSALIL